MSSSSRTLHPGSYAFQEETRRDLERLAQLNQSTSRKSRDRYRRSPNRNSNRHHPYHPSSQPAFAPFRSSQSYRPRENEPEEEAGGQSSSSSAYEAPEMERQATSPELDYAQYQNRSHDDEVMILENEPKEQYPMPTETVEPVTNETEPEVANSTFEQQKRELTRELEDLELAKLRAQIHHEKALMEIEEEERKTKLELKKKSLEFVQKELQLKVEASALKDSEIKLARMEAQKMARRYEDAYIEDEEITLNPQSTPEPLEKKSISTSRQRNQIAIKREPVETSARELRPRNTLGKWQGRNSKME
ncbi:uncharacterized protein CELE_Y46G5A.15 [Caenorhabditis elegans]|uniref:Uncharacterized protein n=1 Tax=Caenorhabditis elegans TaxID=6239 RepID=Q9U2F3_CAEEL|nr:Uncharacterized protein CELE_Y46G5A.15 [Caenorhabditis elegans]CAB60358.2 Uncharacterized protein CELE_Y46G5A.15 [Caenorhabditis elegans]|eukprot:NP_496720.2 Uncharacterized protein CELE_Y46G5A.15 [Caenorhabditis elegans]